MKQLSVNWFYEGLLDEEYKRYVLLAYLQYVKRHFDGNKLYPYLGELVRHYSELKKFQQNRQLLTDQMPRRIEGLDVKRLQLIYKQILQDDDALLTIERIVRFALPEIKKSLDDGGELYDLIEGNITLRPVGILPLHKKEGYLILSSKETGYLVYNYNISAITHLDEHYAGIHVSFLDAYEHKIGMSLIGVKAELIKKFRELPNPATYVAESRLSLPINETFLPMAKKMLLQQVSA